MNPLDVIIIGAGLAGLQCAKLLAGSGTKVLLVDRKSDLTKGIHTTGIFVRKTFEDFSFPVGTLGKPIRKVVLYSPGLRALPLESEKDEFRIGKMDALYCSLLRDCEENGVEFSDSTRFVSADKKGQENIVRLERGGKTFDVTTKVLIGADGAASAVAKSLGLAENKEWIVGCEEVYRVQKPAGEPCLHCFLDSQLAPGYLAWIADDGDEIHLGVGGYPTKFKPREALKKFKEKVLKNFDALQNAELIETRGGRIPVGGVLRNIANEYGLLIGDAAGAVSPLTAGGLDPCLRLSAFAAKVIEKRLTTGDPATMLEFSGDIFRARFVSRLWMRRVISICTNRMLLELGCLFLNGRIGRKLAKHVFFGRGSFPDVEVAEVGRREAGIPII